MCGITGIYSFTRNGELSLDYVERSVETLSKRGPDDCGIYRFRNTTLGHTRLAVIDTSDAASQPFTDVTGRYTIIFNGEFYNYKDLRKILIDKGFRLKSSGDTEVLLYMYILYGVSFIEKVNGCFAIAIYDNVDDILLLLRDRMGIKPLLYYADVDKLVFASEMKAILKYNIPKEIDDVSLYTYLQLNYIPDPYTIFRNVRKLEAGTGIIVKKNKVEHFRYYKIPYDRNSISSMNYDEAKIRLYDLLNESVKRRLVSDVPLGSFLSGGIDSSIITAIASNYVDKLSTFSIGFSDEPFFDETRYAKLLASKFNTEHHVFSLSDNDLFENFYRILDYIDEPFADSSALAVNILSKYTRKNVTVVLSGDGADELFGGYNKHMAHLMAKGWYLNYPVKWLNKSLRLLPQSRDNQFSNKIRQLNRYSYGLGLNENERYWQWCCANTGDYSSCILAREFQMNEFNDRLKNLGNPSNSLEMNDIFYNDMQLVLPGDMLHKVDLMSMSNSLEVRTPFLDHTVVDFVFSLPSEFKINRKVQKKILKDVFAGILPEELLSRKKHGFEVPLYKWFRGELYSLINDNLLSENFIIEQKIFNFTAIKEIKNKLKYGKSADITAKLWGLIVFQYWWKKYFNNENKNN